MGGRNRHHGHFSPRFPLSERRWERIGAQQLDYEWECSLRQLYWSWKTVCGSTGHMPRLWLLARLYIWRGYKRFVYDITWSGVYGERYTNLTTFDLFPSFLCYQIPSLHRKYRRVYSNIIVTYRWLLRDITILTHNFMCLVLIVVTHATILQGEGTRFEVKYNCRYCYQLNDTNYTCTNNDSCSVRGSPSSVYTANCTANQDVFCLREWTYMICDVQILTGESAKQWFSVFFFFATKLTVFLL